MFCECLCISSHSHLSFHVYIHTRASRVLVKNALTCIHTYIQTYIHTSIHKRNTHVQRRMRSYSDWSKCAYRVIMKRRYCAPAWVAGTGQFLPLGVLFADVWECVITEHHVHDRLQGLGLVCTGCRVDILRMWLSGCKLQQHMSRTSARVTLMLELSICCVESYTRARDHIQTKIRIYIRVYMHTYMQTGAGQTRATRSSQEATHAYAADLSCRVASNMRKSCTGRFLCLSVCLSVCVCLSVYLPLSVCLSV